MNPQRATGMTGQSSGRGTCVGPNVCQTTMSWPSMSRSPAMKAGRPAPPGFWFTKSPAGQRWSGSYRVTQRWLVANPARAVSGAAGFGQQDRRGLRVERVTGRTAEAVGAFGADDPPGPAAGAVGPPAGLRLAGQPGHLLDDGVAVGVVRPDRQAADVDLFHGVGQPVHGHVQPRAEQVLVERGGEPRRDLGGVGVVMARMG